jgi:Zinc finger, C3HC4 type (RING finger)
MAMSIKLRLTDSLLHRRNWAIILFLFENLWTLLKLGTDLLRKGKLVILFNVLIFFFSLIGTCGAISFSPIPLIIYILGMLLSFLGLLILFIVSVSTLYITEGDKFTLLLLYIPILVDIFFFLYQAYFIVPFVRLVIKIEKEEKLGRRIQLPALRNPQPVRFEMPRPAENKRNNNQPPIPIVHAPSIEEYKKASEIVNPQVVIPKIEEEPNDEDCLICAVKKKQGAFYPCGHVCCCTDCGPRFKNGECPYCRTKVNDFIKIFNV